MWCGPGASGADVTRFRPAGTISSIASHQDAQAVHVLLQETFQDEAAATEWFERCRSVFCWSQHFSGAKRLQRHADNGAAVADKVSQLSLNGHR